MKANSIEVSVSGTLDEAITLATNALQKEGFGVLTRIDLHKKFSAALGKEITPTVVLGACAPELAHAAMELNADIALFLPCNVVIREQENNHCSVKIGRPTAVFSLLADARLAPLAERADEKLLAVASLLACPENSTLEHDVEEECWDRDLRWGISEQRTESSAPGK